MAMCMPSGSFMGYPGMGEEDVKLRRLINDGTREELEEYLESRRGGPFDPFDFLHGPNAGNSGNKK